MKSFGASRCVSGVCLAWLLVACRGATPALVPFDPGWWWYYEVTSDVRGEVAHERAYVANERVDDGVLRQLHQVRHAQRLRDTDAGVVHLVDDPREAPHAVLIVPRDPKPGFEWQIDSELRLIESRTFAAEDRLLGRRLPLELTARVAGIDDTVKTPAGEFTHCLHLRFTGTRNVRADRGSLLVEVLLTHEAWYAPGIGLVKATRDETSTSTFLRNGHYAQALRAYGHP